MRSALLLIAAALLSPIAFAADIYIPDDYAKIQDAIRASVDGDTIIVRPDSVNGGPYIENIDFVGKMITVKSEMGAEFTTIDGNQMGSVVEFLNGEGPESILDGFTVTNEFSVDGGGIYCGYSSSPTITNNIITRNTAKDYGGGTCCWDKSFAIIINNTINVNCAVEGGGIYCIDIESSVTIANNIILENSASDGGGITCFSSHPTIISNIIVKNTASDSGGGIWCDNNSSPAITNNTFYGNKAGNGGGIYAYQSNPQITNTIFWNNSPNELPVGLDVTYCDVKGGYTGTGNIDADPLFIDPANGDFHIPFDSPCRSAGDRNAPNLPDIDFEGDPRTGLFAFPDIGADEFHTHFYVNGTVTQGSTATGVIIGWPKTNPVMLISGSGVLPSPDPTPFGDFWLMPPWEHRIHFNPIPDNGVRIIDRVVSTGLAPGTQIPFQALVGTELSNLWVIEIE